MWKYDIQRAGLYKVIRVGREIHVWIWMNSNGDWSSVLTGEKVYQCSDDAIAAVNAELARQARALLADLEVADSNVT